MNTHEKRGILREYIPVLMIEQCDDRTGISLLEEPEHSEAFLSPYYHNLWLSVPNVRRGAAISIP